MVQLKNLGKWYYKSEKVLDSINLNLKAGDFLYILGGSGAGKSTLLRMLATEEKPSKGSIEIFGYDLARVNALTLKAIRRSIGYMPQDVRLIPDLSVYDNVFLSLKFSGKKKSSVHNQSALLELLDKLGLAQKRNVLCENLSGGEAQRVAFARAIIRSPELILADEPTGAQDRNYTWFMMDEFVKANESGTTLLLATHDQEIVKRVQKKWVVLKNGKIQPEERMMFL